jgi:2-dehydro-3-deoxyphosphogluconate aldolase/(4S)-4-hydroxy-2-oxoglutarate aldolase
MISATKEAVRNRILEIGIVPVVRAASADLARIACKAIAQGGIPIVEVTMTVPCAIEVIAELRQTMGREVLIGAGTVLDACAARACLDAGAQFLVSPGFDRETVELAKSASVVIMAGGLTPTEVITAWKAGADFIKVFPCGNVGGPAYIKSLKAALPQIPMVPTGGVNLTTAAAFLDAGASALGIGSELVSASALARGKPEEITEAARQYVAIVSGRARK